MGIRSLKVLLYRSIAQMNNAHNIILSHSLSVVAVKIEVFYILIVLQKGTNHNKER
jgi:hypothetical protein